MKERDTIIVRIVDMLCKITDVNLLDRIYRFVKYVYIYMEGRDAA